MSHARDCACYTDIPAESHKPFINPRSLACYCPLDNGPQAYKLPESGSTRLTGENCLLQSLPVEVYHACLQHLDIWTITTLRRVSQYTRSVIDTLRQYKELYEHVPHALRACLAVGIAEHIPLRRLHEALTTLECYYCKTSSNAESNFGSYLSLYEGRRVCLFCIRNNPSLRPIELATLLRLCMQRNSTINLANTLRIHTLLSATLAEQSIRRTMLVASCCVKTHKGKTLTEKESIAIHGNTRSMTVYHHPFVTPEDESDISSGRDFTPPDATKETSQRYLSVISFPYLLSNRQNLDSGVLCTDCVLDMLYQESEWKRIQHSRNHGHRHILAPVSDRRRALIMNARRMACKQYTHLQESQKDVEKMNEKGLDAGQLSIQEHRRTHVGEERDKYQSKWRKGHKFDKNSLLGLQRYG